MIAQCRLCEQLIETDGCKEVRESRVWLSIIGSDGRFHEVRIVEDEPVEVPAAPEVVEEFPAAARLARILSRLKKYEKEQEDVKN